MTRFFQFGTSRLLQAHADLFVDEALGPDQICVVQTSGNSSTLARLNALADKEGFPVRIKGLRNSQIVDKEVRVRSVHKAISASAEWAAVEDEFLQAEFVISNVSERGYTTTAHDAEPAFDPRMSFIAKLLLLLKFRFANGGHAPVIMPLELFESNGDKLRALVLRRARERAQPKAFISWLESCIWVNSLVDRIVSEPIEPAGAVAEPYALWAVQKTDGLEFPFAHEALRLTSDLSDYQMLKLYILNLSHSYIASNWAQRRMPSGLTVREYLSDESRVDELLSFQTEEILPGFAAAGLGDKAEKYRSEILDRFKNPFLNHRISDIFDGHRQKVKSRACGFLTWASANGDTGSKPRIEQLIELSSGGG